MASVVQAGGPLRVQGPLTNGGVKRADCSSSTHHLPPFITLLISLCFSVFLSFLKYLLHQLLQLKMHLLGFTPNYWIHY